MLCIEKGLKIVKDNMLMTTVYVYKYICKIYVRFFAPLKLYSQTLQSVEMVLGFGVDCLPPYCKTVAKQSVNREQWPKHPPL